MRGTGSSNDPSCVAGVACTVCGSRVISLSSLATLSSSPPTVDCGQIGTSLGSSSPSIASFSPIFATADTCGGGGGGGGGRGSTP